MQQSFNVFDNPNIFLISKDNLSNDICGSYIMSLCIIKMLNKIIDFTAGEMSTVALITL